jgi:hypothetical protein
MKGSRLNPLRSSECEFIVAYGESCLFDRCELVAATETPREVHNQSLSATRIFASKCCHSCHSAPANVYFSSGLHVNFTQKLYQI